MLHPQLAADTLPVGRFALSRVLLMNDARFPWLVLVPERPNLREIHDLAEAERAVLIEEIAHCGRVLTDLFDPTKINTGALGNMVDQLHVHVIARGAGDAAWPGGAWGAGKAQPYAPDALDERVARLRGALFRLRQAK